MEEIREGCLLRLVRHLLGMQVRQLKAAPVSEDQGLFDGGSIPEGVPVVSFPCWLVCTHRKLLALLSTTTSGRYHRRGAPAL
jgi:hypothetical protein